MTFDVLELVGPMDNLDARLEHEAELASFRDVDTGKFVLAINLEGKAIVIRPEGLLARFVQRLAAQQN
jgi:hypothetical protein